MKGFNGIETKYRRIVSDIPHPDSMALINELRENEPASMYGFTPVIWERAEGFQVWDPYGNIWIDFTSAVVLANAGHSNPQIGKAIMKQLEKKMWHNYCHPSEIRLRVIKALKSVLPSYLDKLFLLSTGSETTECALKLSRMYGSNILPGKIHTLSFTNSFHGRTMGSALVCGSNTAPKWMGGKKPKEFHFIPFPDCSLCPWGREKYENCGRECFKKGLEQIREQGFDEQMFSGVFIETFQGPFVNFMPVDYIKELRNWADRNKVLVIFDEMQAGFGRTGKWFGFEHYGVKADLICMGKGLTSSLPMSAIAGRREIMDIPVHGEMSSTHTGNPLCCAAAIANIENIRSAKLVENASNLGETVYKALEGIKQKYCRNIGVINGKGLVWSIYLFKPGTKELDVKLGESVTEKCMKKGLLLFQTSLGLIKIAPPLCINEEALLEGLYVIDEAIGECINHHIS